MKKSSPLPDMYSLASMQEHSGPDEICSDICSHFMNSRTDRSNFDELTHPINDFSVRNYYWVLRINDISILKRKSML